MLRNSAIVRSKIGNLKRLPNKIFNKSVEKYKSNAALSTISGRRIYWTTKKFYADFQRFYVSFEKQLYLNLARSLYILKKVEESNQYNIAKNLSSNSYLWLKFMFNDYVIQNTWIQHSKREFHRKLQEAQKSIKSS